MTMGTRICVLNAGELQQIDSPYNLYHNPRNVFVGGFIGSPSMNFFGCHYHEDPDGEAVALKVDAGVFEAARSAQPRRGLPVAPRQEGRSSASGPRTSTTAQFQPPGIVPANIEANGGRRRADG
jgi:ABC-type sugar transport system ATPase subunit